MSGNRGHGKASLIAHSAVSQQVWASTVWASTVWASKGRNAPMGLRRELPASADSVVKCRLPAWYSSTRFTPSRESFVDSDHVAEQSVSRLIDAGVILHNSDLAHQVRLDRQRI